MNSMNPIVIATAVVLAALATSACENKMVMPTPPAEVPVRTALVELKDIANEYEFPAAIKSPQMVEINARVPGWLLAQVTPDGATVKKGQILYSIDPSQYRIALDAANAQLAQATAQGESGKSKLDQANAQLVFAQGTYDRNKGLVESGAVSKEKFDQYTSQLAEAKAATEQARADIAGAAANQLAATAQIDNAKLNLSYCTVACPLDGMFGESKYYEGSLVGDASKQLLNNVVQTNPIWATFSPSANYLPEILANYKAGTLAVSVRLEGVNRAPVPGMPLSPKDRVPSAKGQLVFVDNKVSDTTDTILLRIEFANPDTEFRPGSYAMVTLGLGTQHGATVVPKSAVVARQSELFVWKVLENGTVESTRVEAISGRENNLIITDGVKAGDRIVVEGLARLRPGAKINDLGKATAAAPDAQPTATPATGAPGKR
ncbi:RND transporter [Planctomycetota bacterium]|nr:RND transporter [Planctomycetota bacterium]